MTDLLGPDELIVTIIHSCDLTRDGLNILHNMEDRVKPFLDVLTETEGDEQYEFDYLADESGPGRDCDQCQGDGGAYPWDNQAGYARWSMEFGGMGPIPACNNCGGSGNERDRYRNGYHRKWYGEMQFGRWIKFADAYLIDLDEQGIPVEYNETMGMLTGFGALPAVAVEDTEGWGYNGEVIYSSVYVSMGMYSPSIEEAIAA